MPIRINLLTEALAEEDMRRRDPVKRSIYIGVFLVALSLVWYSSTWLEYKMVQQKYTQIEEQMQSNTNDFIRVQSDLKKITDGQKRLAALQQLSTNRFLQGTLLNALQQIYVPNVQLTRMKIDQSFTYKEGTPAQTNGYGVVAGRPAVSTERTMLTLDARDSSANPGDQVNRYKDAVIKLGYFSTSLATNGVRLANLSPPQVSWNSKPFVQFTLECRFPDKTR
jgi:hypothetical protein